jgi:hypothetical protein
VILVGPPTNDLLQSKTLASIQTNIAAILDACAGTPVVLMTALPNDNYTAGQKTVRRQYNVWLQDTIARTRRDVMVFDANRYIEDITTGGWVSGYASDGTHPNYAGAVRIGEALANFLQNTPIFVQQPPLWTHTGDDSNLLSNGIPTGSGGTASGGVTGTCATSWTAFRSSGAGTAVASVVARTDGVQGNAQRLVIASGAGTSQFTIQQQISLPTVGRIIYGEAEVKIPGDWVSPYRLQLVMAFAGGTGGFSVWDLRTTGADVALGYAINRTLRLRTPAVAVPSGPTAVQLQIWCGADSGTLDLLGAAIRDAGQAGPV